MALSKIYTTPPVPQSETRVQALSSPSALDDDEVAAALAPPRVCRFVFCMVDTGVSGASRLGQWREDGFALLGVVDIKEKGADGLEKP